MNIRKKNLLSGFSSFIEGIKLVSQPGLRQYVIWPLLINTLLFGFASWFLWQYLTGLVDTMLPSWLSWLAWLILPLFATSILAIVYFSFTLLANIIAAPFYGFLAQKVEHQLTGKTNNLSQSRSFFNELLATTGSELRKISYYLLRAIPLLLLSLIPGINVIALPLWFVFSAWFLSIEYTGYTFENNHIPFKEQKKLLKNDPVNSLTFGAITLLATTTPIVNLFAPAVAVAGATKMLIENDLIEN